MKTYYLRNTKDNNRIVAKLEVKSDSGYSIIGQCFSAVSWCIDSLIPIEYDFVAEVYCKWDACTHWNFWGSDYYEDEKEHDAYYHLCGPRTFNDHIRIMCFVWKVAREITNTKASLNENYYDTEENQELIEFMLKDYTIEEAKGE